MWPGGLAAQGAAPAPQRRQAAAGQGRLLRQRRPLAQALRAVFPALLLRCCDGLPSRILGRQLLVGDQPVHLKGVNWNPVPRGGMHPQDLDFRGFVEVDAELMARAGINAVRTYEAIIDVDVLDELWKRKIYVLNTVYCNAKDPMEMVSSRVNAVKDHPAVLLWVVGNEWNYNGLYQGLPFEDSLARLHQAVDLIKAADATHPVATIHGELPSADTLLALSNVDLWGVNKYDGLSFGDMFERWASVSPLPMFLGEYGADAFDSRSGLENQEDQARATAALTSEIVQASSVTGGVCIGGMLFEFVDEWWKDGGGDPDEHDIGGVSPGGGPFPDLTFNEEWWGIVALDGHPRKAFFEYAKALVPNSLIALGANPGNVQGIPSREQACGAHRACAGLLGYCCPDRRGKFNACCTSQAPATSTSPRERRPSTTWVPAEPQESPGSSRLCGHEAFYYEEAVGKFANGHFPVATLGCRGVGECQFVHRDNAEEFCSMQPKCTSVLLHPFEDDCAGGYGCYTPRFGTLDRNGLWARSGGRAWRRVEEKSPCDKKPEVYDSQLRYAFMGFMSAIEAQTACKHTGILAMPKTPADQEALRKVIDAAQAAGKMSDTWPQNTVWLGGHFDPDVRQWLWDDGTPIEHPTWARGQPSAASLNQMTEPWLCMYVSGEMHDSAPPYDFGVFCELGAGEPRAQPIGVATGGVEAFGSEAETTSTQTITSTPLTPAEPTTTVPTTTRTTTSATPTTTTRAPTETKTTSSTLPVSTSATTTATTVTSTATRTSTIATTTSKTATSRTTTEVSTAITSTATTVTSTATTISRTTTATSRTTTTRTTMEVSTSITTTAMTVTSTATTTSRTTTTTRRPTTTRTTTEATTETATTTPGITTEDVPVEVAAAAGIFGRFHFAGFGGPEVARAACEPPLRPVMPKSASEMRELMQAIQQAIAAEKLGSTWPQNTIWLGGKWDSAGRRWAWDDGSEATGLPWAEGRPGQNDREDSPWLTLVSNGKVYDTDPPYEFGIVCQEAPPAESRASLRGGGGSGKAPARSPAAAPTPAAQRGPWQVHLPYATYTFVGFTGPVQARSLCLTHGQLAAADSPEATSALLEAIRAATEAQVMGSSWPQNTIWLGGAWSAAHQQWEWDDGSLVVDLGWAEGQPSGAAQQTQEPWLCMLASGEVHDTDPPYDFGAMCELKANQVATEAAPQSLPS